MSAYVKALHEAVEDDQTRLRERQIAAARDRLTPLEDRLARLLDTIPLDVQREGVGLPALQAALKGRWRGNCHPGELGIALRKLGFRRIRSWTGGEGFRAVWSKGK
jgi:hypothetical protein